LLSNMCLGFGGDLFIQAIGTPMRTNCASNLASSQISDQAKYGVSISQFHRL